MTDRDDVLARLLTIGREHAQLRAQLDTLEMARDREIRAARKQGVTMQQIADLVGLTKGRISQIEKGIR